MPAAVFDEVEAFARALPARGALVGLDLGTKTIGVAVSDVTRLVATPLETIRRVKFTPDVERLESIMAERDIVGVVIGLPLNMDDSEGPRAQSTRAFVREFAKRISAPFCFWDERLSTDWSHDHLIAQGMKSPTARAEVIDRVAASHILQGALDRMRALKV
ncbi:Holliday junction resolvase RuvX [Terrarubrum flagellatum]|uniref:Holliday junction resolvase RuvX n=1 Tax=Terrirubrum flagellatum TaxID=2895980 RepID=UPI003145427B